MFDTFKFNLDSIDPTVCFDIYFETVCSSLLLTRERHIPNTTATTFLRVLRLVNVFRKRLSFDKVETKIFAKGKACLKSSIKPPSYNSCNPMIIQSQCERFNTFGWNWYSWKNAKNLMTGGKMQRNPKWLYIPTPEMTCLC